MAHLGKFGSVPMPLHVSLQRLAFAALVSVTAACGDSLRTLRAPVLPALGQWIWTRDDLALFAESAAQRPGLEAGVFIGAIHCDQGSGRLVARAGLSPSLPQTTTVTAVIRFEDGLDRCRTCV